MAPLAPLAKAAAAALIFALAACGGDTGNSEAQTEAVVMGDISIEPGFVRKPSVGALSTAAYLDITSASDDRLINASSELATVEIHTMTMDGGAMQMRRIESLDLPEGKVVALERGGYHLMLINPDAALGEVTETEITLVFEKAGEMTVTLPVKRASGTGH